jgi:hypothetical protein
MKRQLNRIYAQRRFSNLNWEIDHESYDDEKWADVELINDSTEFEDISLRAEWAYKDKDTGWVEMKAVLKGFRILQDGFSTKYFIKVPKGQYDTGWLADEDLQMAKGVEDLILQAIRDTGTGIQSYLKMYFKNNTSMRRCLSCGHKCDRNYSRFSGSRRYAEDTVVAAVKTNIDLTGPYVPESMPEWDHVYVNLFNNSGKEIGKYRYYYNNESGPEWYLDYAKILGKEVDYRKWPHAVGINDSFNKKKQGPELIAREAQKLIGTDLSEFFGMKSKQFRPVSDAQGKVRQGWQGQGNMHVFYPDATVEWKLTEDGSQWVLHEINVIYTNGDEEEFGGYFGKGGLPKGYEIDGNIPERRLKNELLSASTGLLNKMFG